MNFTSQSIQSTFQYILHVESGSQVYNGTGSQLPFLDITSSYANTGSNNFYVQGGITFVSSSNNATIGSVALSSGTANVSSSAVQSNSIILLTGQDNGGGANLGSLYVASRVAGTSFTINSTNLLSSQLVGWVILQQG